MSANENDTNKGPSLHVVFGSGGTKAILAGTGAVLAFRVAGMTSWKSVGSASGGTVPAILLASGKAPADFLADVIEVDYNTKITARGSTLSRMITIFRKYHYEQTRPAQGAWGTGPFQKFVDEKVPFWPATFWAVAACGESHEGHGQVLFTKNGVYKYPFTAPFKVADKGRLVSAQPPTPGVAVGASCAMPGILDAVKYQDEYLFDGALAGDGDTPIGVVPRHFGDSRLNVVAVDVGDETIKQSWWLRLLFNIGCGGRCPSIESRHAKEGDALLVIKTPVEHFHALQFELSRDDKWWAIVNGFVATALALAKSNLIGVAEKKAVLTYANDLNKLVTANIASKRVSCEVESYLSQRGMYAPPQCKTTR